MPDLLFAHPRRAAIYDFVDDDRSDLDAYVALVEELGSARIAILSDLDGTLIDSKASVIRAFEWWADLRGLPPGVADRIPHGRTSTAAAAVLAPHLDAETEGAILDERQREDTEGVIAL